MVDVDSSHTPIRSLYSTQIGTSTLGRWGHKVSSLLLNEQLDAPWCQKKKKKEGRKYISS